LDHARLPDPVARAMTNLTDNLNRLSARLTEIEERQDCLEDKMTEDSVPPSDRPLTKDRQ
jgi:hypothetical protein